MNALPSQTLSNRQKRLNARQRKKQRVGEFCDFGFEIRVQLTDDLDIQAQDRLLDTWLDTIERFDVSFGGEFDARQSLMLTGVVFPVGKTKVNDTVRQELTAWLQTRPEVSSVSSSELIEL